MKNKAKKGFQSCVVELRFKNKESWHRCSHLIFDNRLFCSQFVLVLPIELSFVKFVKQMSKQGAHFSPHQCDSSKAAKMRFLCWICICLQASQTKKHETCLMHFCAAVSKKNKKANISIAKRHLFEGAFEAENALFWGFSPKMLCPWISTMFFNVHICSN